MNSLQKIGKFEAISVLVMVMINQIIINLPNIIIRNTGSSAWLNIIYITIIAILFCFLICKLFKSFANSDILDVSEYLGGKFFKIFIGFLYILFFIFSISLSLRYFSNSIRLIYFERSPSIFIYLLFLIPITFVAKLGIKDISKVSLIFTPVLLLGILVILFATTKNFIPQRIYPIMGFGAKETFLLGFNNIFAFSFFAYLYFLIPFLKEPNQFKTIAVSSTIISAIYLFLSVICLIMLSPSIAFSDELLSIYLITRMIEFGTFLQRIDAIFIFIWIFANLSLLTFSVNMVSNIFKKLTNIKNSGEIVFSISSIVLGILFLFDDIAITEFFQKVIFKYVTISLVFILSTCILLFANFKLKRSKSNEI